MASYVTLTTTRATIPDPVALLAAVKAVTDDTAVLVAMQDLTWRGKKATDWSASDISAAQNALDTVVAFDEALANLDRKELKAVLSALWECIPSPLMTKAQTRQRAIAIYRGLV
jgi:hypothetical protein